MKKMKSRNQTFQWLEALAIIMVIDDHVSTRVGILSSVFPYNSFYMPMLVFISGYFFKNRSVGEGIQHKVLNLLVPICNMVPCWRCLGICPISLWCSQLVLESV